MVRLTQFIEVPWGYKQSQKQWEKQLHHLNSEIYLTLKSQSSESLILSTIKTTF